MELLKTLYSIYSPSAGEKKMKRFIKRWIYNNIPEAEIKTDTKGNIYVTKGKAENYPCIVAHLDQVQKTHSKDFVCVESEDVIFGYSPKNRRQEGLGADDKNGIWIALKCLQKYNTLKAAFFVEEEIGCRGSAASDIAFFTDCRFIIQCDRRGNKDLITSISFTELCSDEFISATGHETFGYTPADGLMTDVLELKESGVEVSCINLSCGYYQPHSDEEFTDKRDLLNCQRFVEHIIENCTAVYPHKLKNYYSSRSRHWDKLEELYMITEDILSSCPDVTAEEIKEYYGCYFSGLRLEDYQNILDEVRELNESIDDKKHTA